MRRQDARRRFGPLVSVGMLCGLTLVTAGGCKRDAAPPAPPPPFVTVARPLEREVIEWDDYTGYLGSPEAVDLRARVSGEIVKADFAEGQPVKKGDLLFQIDDAPYLAELNARKAAVAQAQAQLALNQVTFRRYEQAEPGAAVSKQEYDTAKANVQLAEAQLAGAKAAEDAAQLNVNYCRVVAPISGRSGRRLVTPGNLVTSGVGAGGQGTLLTTIVSLDPIYLYVTVDERSVLKYRQLAAEGRRVSARDQRIPCFMGLLNEEGFPHVGYVDFVDNKIDPTTGTLLARGVFPNPDTTLTPGLYGRSRIPGSGRYTALLIPEEAIGSDQNIKYVLTVGPGDVVQSHPVKLGALFGTLRAIESGITRDDRVIINGMMKARPGGKVQARESTVDASAMSMTAPGSPTTQALPATRPFVPGTAAPTTARSTSAPATAPTTGGKP